VRPVARYLGAAFGLSIALSVVLAATGAQRSPAAFLAMVIPAAALVVVGAPSVDWGRFPAAYLPAALFLMPAVMHAAMLPVTVLYAGGIPWRSDSAAHILASALFGIAIVSMLALFEEVGWRAWLLPELETRLGGRGAVVAVSAIWAIWHLPYVLSGILHFDHVPTIQAAAILPLGQFGAGLILGWLWTRSRSIWIVSIAHGALNNWGQFAFKFMQDDPVVNAHEAAILLAGSLALVAVGAALLARRT
jgi:membrane protease YdiL (CAAX protease family)